MDTTHKTTTNDRETASKKGRFRKGNPGGPGNPYARQCAEFRKAIHNAVTNEDIQNIIAAMKQRALEGDVAAAKLVLAYAVGKPMGAADPDTIDRHEVQTVVANHVDFAEQLEKIMNGMPADVVAALSRVLLPKLKHQKAEKLKDILFAPRLEEDEDEDEEDEYTAEELAEFERARAADDAAMTAWIREQSAGKAKRPDEVGSPMTNGKLPASLADRLHSPMANGRHGPMTNGKL